YSWGCNRAAGESSGRTCLAPRAGSAAPGAHPRPAVSASASYPSVPCAHLASIETLLHVYETFENVVFHVGWNPGPRVGDLQPRGLLGAERRDFDSSTGGGIAGGVAQKG